MAKTVAQKKEPHELFESRIRAAIQEVRDLLEYKKLSELDDMTELNIALSNIQSGVQQRIIELRE